MYWFVSLERVLVVRVRSDIGEAVRVDIIRSDMVWGVRVVGQLVFWWVSCGRGGFGGVCFYCNGGRVGRLGVWYTGRGC